MSKTRNQKLNVTKSSYFLRRNEHMSLPLDLELRVLSRDKQAVIVHHMDERGIWASCNRKILYRSAKGIHWRKTGSFPVAFPRDCF